MDINIANDFLQGLVAQKQKEIDAFNLCLSILNITFQAEFTSRDSAIKEAEKIPTIEAERLAQKQRADAAEALVIEKQTIINDLTAQVTALQPAPPIDVVPTPVVETPVTP